MTRNTGAINVDPIIHGNVLLFRYSLVPVSNANSVLIAKPQLRVKRPTQYVLKILFIVSSFLLFLIKFNDYGLVFSKFMIIVLA